MSFWNGLMAASLSASGAPDCCSEIIRPNLVKRCMCCTQETRRTTRAIGHQRGTKMSGLTNRCAALPRVQYEVRCVRMRYQPRIPAAHAPNVGIEGVPDRRAQ